VGRHLTLKGILAFVFSGLLILSGCMAGGPAIDNSSYKIAKAQYSEISSPGSNEAVLISRYKSSRTFQM